MKRKIYEQPEIEVVKLEQTDIICTSGTLKSDEVGFQELEDGGTIEWDD